MLKSITFQNKVLKIPIIQGGMGVGISLGNLAGSVMKEGAMGVISAAHPGYQDPTFNQDCKKANQHALLKQVEKARRIAQGKGLLAINIMVASKDYAYYVKAAIEAKVDAIISGAGLPLDLPKLVEGKDILIAPIVSSAKAARLILKVWNQRYETRPDFIVIEGDKAGGHLGFKKQDLIMGKTESLETILKGVIDEVKPYRETYKVPIPLFVAGGIFDHKDILHMMSLGASGVQMGTRFIATHECDASDEFKQAILHCKKEDIGIVDSPTGFPGRAIINQFVKDTRAKGRLSISQCLNCLSPCRPNDTPYCISQALIQAVKGNIDKGLIFVGENASRVNQIMSVKELVDELVMGVK